MKSSIKNQTSFGFETEFDDFYKINGLKKLDQKFDEFLSANNSPVIQEFALLKQKASHFSKHNQSRILIDVAKILEDFLSELFDIKEENFELRKKYEDLQKIYFVRREFVQRVVAKKFCEAPSELDLSRVCEEIGIIEKEVDEIEKQLAEKIFNLLKKEKNLSESEQKQLELLTLYTASALYDSNTKSFHKTGALFILPQKIDHQNLTSNQSNSAYTRNGFDLTDKGFSLNRILAETHYCIFCHKQEKDSCRKGLHEKGVTEFKKDPLGIELHGCPLEEKISEMNLLKSEGFSIAALAMAVIDNPMIAGTGHRICNDCMKSCIFQKQDPVDIPQVETRVLKDVLSLPYGFEIYSLLTRWNPLNLESSLPKNPTGKKILVAGLGPAGYTLAHYLLNEGHDVVAIDGLKIEPLNQEISGIDEFGNRQEFRPIKFLDEIYEPLSKRLIQGFGGVAEYGITVRFDKNFLKVIRLLLERRSNFRMFGGIRFGSSITDKIAFEYYGFDHIALCIGAGRPHIINFKNNFAKGIRLASDFLMSLQLTGSFKEELFTNLQIRMPIVVIGGGLTAVDTACEASAYYIVQIKKFAKKVAIIGKGKVFLELNEEEKIIAEEFLQHAYELETIGSQALLKKYGGVKILYRKKIQDSPSYRLNHQELTKAFGEGVEFIENIIPIAAEIDEFNHVKALQCENQRVFRCGSLLVAAGTSPNISPVLEDGLDFKLDGKYFSSITPGSVITKIDPISKKAVSFFGDLHPSFEGNVVKAISSAKRGYKDITEVLKNSSNKNLGEFFTKITSDFLVQIEKIERLSDHVVQIFVRAPLLAKQTKIGHIFRLQNYHIFAKKMGDQLAVMEGVAVTAISVDRPKGIISCIVVETGGSTSLIKNFKVGEPCVFMGPSGNPTEIPQNEIVVLIGGGRGNQPITAIARECKTSGCKVILFAGYKNNSFVVSQKEMEDSCDILVYAFEEVVQNFKLNRSQDQYFQGKVTDVLKDYFTKNPQKIDRIFTIGNDRMMDEIAKLRHKNLVESISMAPIAITSLNAPMQCMMKGVCSQCLQKRTNEKGEEEFFYACANQDQNMDRLDFQHLHNRCEQNSLAEKVSRMQSY